MTPRLLPLASAVAAWCACGEAAPADDWVRVQRGDLVLDVEVTGMLRAAKTDTIGPPVIPTIWEYKIAFMAPEGALVAAGEPLLGFDTSSLQKTLLEKQNESSSVQKTLEKRQLALRMAQRDEELRIAEAEARRHKAALKVERPTDLVGSIELQQARLDLELARQEVSYLRSRAALVREQEAASLAALEDQRQRADARVRETKDYIARMTVRAARAGTVIYASNQRDVKKKVGDSVWRAEKVLESADLARMTARGEVDEVDASRVAVGQRVRLRLDAHREIEFTGTVRSIARTVQRQSPSNANKVVHLEVALDASDPLRMRPGMRFRGAVETGRVAGVLLVPAASVFLTGHGAVAYLRQGGGYGAAPITAGRRNRELVEVRAGLTEGDEVARDDPTRAAPGATPRGQGTP